ncbi:cob(I)yrinic acid a,c-diamide adenosyltransferase [Pelosinus propionicus]|uniref:Cob(I)yrinic acid a,c-diamide adenosyltransferase n=1 Tax=Pelosinus propionicus DSM 13327 TaxID=1123291 RepID=A0A1I4N4M6_9FIRM|nr:cob(I)yrinic acid a,c-diamide adenosyltransferase [Pelosinus propionicus]SFM10534.1 cob(I)yrinic acid a,c-diamide adenosyltransferase [Pelosinus propionicus DSM 13327]
MENRHGLILVNTENGKGKTTAALGLGLRAWGQGFKVLIIQFIKGSWKYGELKAAEALGSKFVMRQMGEGFVRNASEDAMAEHRHAAEEALAMARKEFESNQWDMIILDEINYAIKFGVLSLEAVLNLLEDKPSALHLVLTGRDVRPEIVEKADLVTEMKEIKHPYKKGIKAQKGIEF